MKQEKPTDNKNGNSPEQTRQYSTREEPQEGRQYTRTVARINRRGFTGQDEPKVPRHDGNWQILRR